MNRNSTANAVLIVLAVIGALVVLPGLFSLAGGIVGLIITLLIWMFIGMLAGRIMRGRGFGFLGDVLLGLIGGFVGSWLLGTFGVQMAGAGLLGTIIAGVVGAIVVIAVARLFDRNFAR
jgi:uncharacterized membrane protein YeaQ/YmgE (transglycosylase-associated protein family)